MVDCKLKRNAGVWIALAYHRLEVFDLFDKLILHAVPHDLHTNATIQSASTKPKAVIHANGNGPLFFVLGAHLPSN